MAVRTAAPKKYENVRVMYSRSAIQENICHPPATVFLSCFSRLSLSGLVAREFVRNRGTTTQCAIRGTNSGLAMPALVTASALAWNIGAPGWIRTNDQYLGGFGVMEIEWAGLDSNQRPRDYESPALTG